MFYENYFHNAIDCPEYLKNTNKKYVKLSLFSKRYKFVCFLL